MAILVRFRKLAVAAFALAVLIVAQMASTQFSLFFYQDEIPEALKKRNK